MVDGDGYTDGVNRNFKAWIHAQIGFSRPYGSVRQLGLASGLAHSTLGAVLRTGRADPKTAIALARACRANPVALLHLAGHLTDREWAELTQPSLPEEEEFVALFRALRPQPILRRAILAGMRAALAGGGD